ncbi:MAG: YihY family inner membrane protein [Planctomycetes bacterium]|nr:YihY family inner membrane protein [Planctomycetota bacterium]
MTWLLERWDRAAHAVRTGWKLVNTDLWEAEAPPEARLVNFLLDVVRSVVLLFHGFIRAEVNTRAAALTYKTVFALVPSVAVVFAVLRAFGSLSATEARLKSFLIGNLAQGTGQKVVDAIMDAIDNIHNGAVGGIGFLVLAWTVISLMRDIEESLDRIWFLEEDRPFVARLAIYWTVLTLAPIFIGFSITLTALFMDRSVVQELLANEWISAAISIFLPLLIVWIIFACLYSFVPNTKVYFGSAVLAAVIAGSVWEVTKRAYLWYNTQVVTQYKVYGTLGAIPILLLWIYVSWVVFLTGAQISFAVQNRRGFKRNERVPRASAWCVEVAAVKIACALTQDFLRGAPPATLDGLAVRLDLPTRLVQELLDRLLGAGLILRLGPSATHGVVPARDPATIRLRDVLEAVRTHGTSFRVAEDELMRAVDGALERADESWKQVTAGVTLRDLVQRPGA